MADGSVPGAALFKNLYTCSVGEMANVVRNSHASHGAYAPIAINPSTFHQAARTEIVEPGRLEVRERLFYAELDKILLSADNNGAPLIGDAKVVQDEEAPSRVKQSDPEVDLEQLLLSRLAGECVYRSRKR